MVVVTPATASLTALGATVQLAAEVRDQNGQVMAGAAVAWTSSDASVATVAPTGLVTAAANGVATITATAGSASGTAALTVAQEVGAVTVSPAADTLVTADTVRLAAEAVDANGNPVAGSEFEWASGDTLVAIVDEEGLVIGISAGEVEITAMSAGVSGSAQLTVVVPRPTAVAVTPDTVAFTAIGQTKRLAAEVRDQAGRPLEGSAISWSSGDTLVALVDSAGLVTAVGSGVATVTAMAGMASGAATVMVTPSAGSVVVSPDTARIARGDTLRLVAEAFDENGHVVEAAMFEWASSDVSVVQVDAAGLVTGVAEGRASVTAVVGDVQGLAEITVENPDRAALVALYEATDGPNWVNSENWLTDAPLGEWHGVERDGGGRVVRLDLMRNKLNGPIPLELGYLTSLRKLDLSFNQLNGAIPPELGNLVRMWELRLDRNLLAGAIPPELGSLTSLQRLRLDDNQLTGEIPVQLGNLVSLTSLVLARNQLSGPIPPQLGNLARLRVLVLQYNGLTGPIPSELGNLVRMRELRLHDNQLTGAIPNSFLQLEGLDVFNIAYNAGLCVPGSSVFLAWLRNIERSEHESQVSCNVNDVAALKLLFSATGGTGWTDSGGWLSDSAVSEWYGVAADSLGRVTELDLAGNGLSGTLPSGLGDLTRMTALRIGGNALWGRLPLSLVAVSLREFQYADTDLCAPTEASFQNWLGGIAYHEGTGAECPPLPDREILEILYQATDGPSWTVSDNWLTEAPLREWYGVSADASGRVAALDLRENNLAARIPRELGSLAKLGILDLRGNDLSGPIPPELGNLANLVRLELGGNRLSGQIPSELGNLAKLEGLDLRWNNLSGPIPPELGELARLENLWLVGNRLGGSLPPQLGNLANLVNLDVGRNQLGGSLPPQLANLTSLENLWLGSNRLSGSLPPQLGNLGNLVNLDLGGNQLSGPIPPQFGSLTNLVKLDLWGNQLSGAIPPQLGDLVSLVKLDLENNQLSGAVPGQLGDLASLERLELGENRLSGPVPPQLGNLAQLEELYLASNELSGPVPPEFGGLLNLRNLILTNNNGMKGALPGELTALAWLEGLMAGGTDLCAPAELGFQDWLSGVVRRRIAGCAEAGPLAAYLVQAVQSREFPVPLVAGRKALLRVFPTANRAVSAGIPAVRARFFRNGRETYVEYIAGKSAAIPTAVHDGDLTQSANAEIPGHVVQPGLEMVIEVDPEGKLDPALGVARRIPQAGRLELDVGEMPHFDLTLIPFVWTQTHDSTITGIVNAIADDHEDHEAFSFMHLLPFGEMSVTAHETVLSSSNNASELLRETEAIRVMEGRAGYYMGMMSGPTIGPSGIAYLSGQSSFSLPGNFVMAHELGHNLSLLHTRCYGGSDPAADPFFPHFDGSIGAWGYDFRDGSLVAPSAGDLMGNCLRLPVGISDYHFTNALSFRLNDTENVGLADSSRPRSLLLWGGIGAEGTPFLEPAFVVNAPPKLPQDNGPYRLMGRTHAGTELFSFTFTMPETADGDGSTSFAFVLPLSDGWAGNLGSITLTGPNSSVTMDGETDRPMAILRNPLGGEVRGFLRDFPPASQAVMDMAGGVAGSGLEVLFSRGIPDAAAWRR